MSASRLRDTKFEHHNIPAGEHGGSVVEHLTPEQEVGVQNLPPQCVIEQDNFLPESTGNINEAMAPYQHD